MPTALDHVLFAATALVSPLVDWLWLYPLLRRASAAGVQGARGRAYLAYLVTAWGLTAGVLALWADRGRPWAGLRLGLGTPPQTVLGLVLAAAYLGLCWAQRRALIARPDRLARVLAKVAAAEPLLPHTRLSPRHALRSALAGVFFALVVLAAGSLWPAILIHAAADLISGDLGYRALGRGNAEASPTLRNVPAGLQ